VQTPVALTIAGSDPSGGAGLQADLKTFHQFGVYGESVVTLITVQNTLGIKRVDILDPDLIVEQLMAVIHDIPPHAAKTGALGNAAVVEAIAREAERFNFPLIVDPVMISKNGALLMDVAAQKAVAQLIRYAYLVTPNLPEASVLAGFPVEDLDSICRAAEQIAAMGAKNVLVKGGHLRGKAIDVLFMSDNGLREFSADRIDTAHTHGTGCTYSAAITAELAKGSALLQAVEHAKAFITRAIANNPSLGQGTGPVNHHA
jgi:hydroxymethylpyrimidine/phosphomethylpyrimidine kinase